VDLAWQGAFEIPERLLGELSLCVLLHVFCCMGFPILMQMQLRGGDACVCPDRAIAWLGKMAPEPMVIPHALA
jgi:hypothetical protein